MQRVPEGNFTGTAWIHQLIEPASFNIPIGNVTFEPGVRTYWLSHAGGQVLLAAGGIGYRPGQDGKPDLYVFRNNETPPASQISGVQYYRLNTVAGLSEGEKGRLIPYNRALPVFNTREYVRPIPREELTINPALVQNPGWK